MLMHLIRHAHAGSRKAWKGDDRQRPLSERGTAQAQAIAGDLADAGVDTLWSSDFVRCVRTLEPLARHLSLDVETVPVLGEGADGTAALDALVAAAAGGHIVAASTHGDVVPDIVAAAVERGAHLDGPATLKKGARYEMALVDGMVTRIGHVDASDAHRRS